MENNNPTIQWVEKTVRLTELRPFERNPRKITKEQHARLKASLLADGYHSRIKATIDLRVIGGHQRLSILKEVAAQLGFKDGLIPILTPDREIDDYTFKRLLLTDNHNNGVFDMDMLSTDFDLEFLQGIGLHEVTNIAPMPGADDEQQAGKNTVKCPGCGECFPVKGNKVT